MKELLSTRTWKDDVDAVFLVDGKKIKEKISPTWYFCIENEQVEETTALLKKMGVPGNTQRDAVCSNYTKVKLNVEVEHRPSIIIILEEQGIRTYEADLLADRRLYIDQNWPISSDYVKAYFDIETDDSKGFLEVGRDQIISIAITIKKKKYVWVAEARTGQAEKDILKKAMAVLCKADVIMGWNSAGFDLPYMKARLKKHGMKRELNQLYAIPHIDLLPRFRFIYRGNYDLTRFSLDFIAQYFLKKGKVERTERVIDLWEHNVEKLKEYNLEDAVLVQELDEKLKVSDMMIRQCVWCGVPINDYGLYAIIDALLLRTAHADGKRLRTSITTLEQRYGGIPGKENPNETDTIKKKYLGAIVLDPIQGRYENVYCFDFKGLYPSIIRTSNISPETIMLEPEDGCIINPGTLTIPRKDETVRPTYFKPEESVVSKAITELLAKRKEYKKIKLELIESGTTSGPEWEQVNSDDIVVKELSNSTYGIMGLSFGRYFSVDVAESITLFGQWMLLHAKDFFEQKGHLVCYGDTDSVFVVSKEELDIQSLLDEYHVALHETLKEYNISECHIELEFDKHFSTFILVNKKKYVGMVDNIEGKKTKQLYSKGLEYLKRDTFGFAKKKQREFISYLLPGTNKERADAWIRKTKDEFDALDLKKEDLVLTKRLRKRFDEYKQKTKPVHVRLAEKVHKETGNYALMSEVDYIVTSTSPHLDGELADAWSGEYDKHYYWSQLTLAVLDKVYEAVFGHSFDEESISQKSLF